jgi:TonB family protein
MKIKASPVEWVGRLIDQRFPLFEHLGSAESGDFYRTELPGPHAQKAAIRLVPAEIEGAQDQFDDWAQAEGLAHPNLLRIFESGHGRIDEYELLYVVMEMPDESLDQVLPARTLSGPEAGEMLPPILDALEYLHGRGLVHGQLTPSNILVVGDRVKLSADSLQHAGRLRRAPRAQRVYDAPEVAQGHIASASDIWSLGITLVETLTQLPPLRNPGGDPGVPQFMPEPFADIARNCLRVHPTDRASIDEIRAVLRVPATRTSAVPLTAPVAAPPRQEPPARPAAAAQAAVPQASTARAPQPLTPPPAAPQASRSDTSAPAPDVTFDPIRPARRTVEDGGETPRPLVSTPFIVGMIALILVLIGALYLRSHRSASTTPDSQANTSADATAPPAASTPAAPVAPKRAAKAAAPSAAKPSPESRVPSPAASAVSQAATPAAQGQSGGEVVDRVMPDDRAHADRTIHGKIAVRVKVSVDRQGNVSDATLDQAGPSRYFAKIALDAARKWRFRAPQVNGNTAPSTWLLHFEFRRGGTTVNPVEVAR